MPCNSMGDFTVKHTKRSASALPVDQTLEKAYNKPAKGSSGVIGITKRKEKVLKWNMRKHTKMKYTNFLYDVYSTCDDDEYSIHYEFPSSATALDELQVQQIFASISRHGSPFDLGSSSIKNLVTYSEVDSKLSDFLLKVNEVGETAYKDLKTSRLLEKSAELFDTIPKIRTSQKNIISSKRN